MSKLRTIQDQLEKAKEELINLNKDENQLIFDYVEYSIILIKQLNSSNFKCSAPDKIIHCSYHDNALTFQRVLRLIRLHESG